MSLEDYENDFRGFDFSRYLNCKEFLEKREKFLKGELMSNDKCDCGEKREVTYISELIRSTTRGYLKTMESVLKTHFQPVEIYGIQGFGHCIEFKYKNTAPTRPLPIGLQEKIHEITSDYDIFVEEDEVSVTLNGIIRR